MAVPKIFRECKSSESRNGLHSWGHHRFEEKDASGRVIHVDVVIYCKNANCHKIKSGKVPKGKKLR